MTSAEWALLGAIGAHAAAMVAAIVKLVAWASSTHARIEERLHAIEGKVDNDIAGRRISAEMKSDVAVIKATMMDLKDHVRCRSPVLMRPTARVVGQSVMGRDVGCRALLGSARPQARPAPHGLGMGDAHRRALARNV